MASSEPGLGNLDISLKIVLFKNNNTPDYLIQKMDYHSFYQNSWNLNLIEIAALPINQSKYNVCVYFGSLVFVVCVEIGHICVWI